MKISRRGAYADFGTSTISFPEPKFEWNKSNSSLSVKQQSVHDFSTSSRHNYDISISPEELVQLFSTLAAAALSDPQTFEEKMGASLKSIAQLHGVLTGLVRASALNNSSPTTHSGRGTQGVSPG